MRGHRGHRRLQLPLALFRRRVQAQEHTHLTNLYAMLTQANQAILRASDEARLFQDICGICVEFGHFGLAWIAIMKAGKPWTVAAAGPMQGYLDGLAVSVDPDDPLGRGPTGRAFRGESVICDNWAEEPRMEPWRERAARFGIRSSGSFPVRTPQGVEAVLTLHADRAGPFRQGKVELLEELTSNIAFALDKFRLERQRVEDIAALREKEKLYQDLVKALPAGIYRLRVRPAPATTAKDWERVYRTAYEIEFVSDRFCEIAGLDREAFQADPGLLLERIHPEDRAEFSARNAEALTGLLPFRWEGRLLGDTPQRWIRFESTPRSLDGGGTLWTGTLLDITEQHRVATALAASHAVLAGIQESAEGPIFSVDRAYRYTSFNQAHTRVMKALYGQEVTLGSSPLDLQVVLADHDRSKAGLDRALAGEICTEAFLAGDEALSQRWFEVTHSPVRSSDGAVVGAAVFARDITQRRLAEATTNRMTDLLSQTGRIAGVGGWEVDLETQSLYWTDQTFALHDLEPGAYAPTVVTALQFYAPEWRPFITSAVQAAIATGKAFDLELELITAKGRRIWAHTTGRVITRDGKVVKVLGAFQDISERKRLETEIRDLNRSLERRVVQRTHQLEVAKDELEAFAYSVSHDLRAPLRAIAGFTGALLQDGDSSLSAEGVQHLQRIQGGTTRMAQIIEDLLKLSRIGRNDCTMVPLDLASLAEQILAGLRSAEPERLVDCHVQHPILIQGDPRLLRILLENLLGNAWKFTSKVAAPRIDLEARPLGEAMMEIAIRDNGAGFPPAQAGKLFTPFHRQHKQSDFPGTGIGLAIARRIVSRHRGRIRAEGEVGLGAVIQFTLPMVKEELS